MVWRDAQDVDRYWLNAVLHEEGAWTAGTFGDVTIELIGAEFGLAGQCYRVSGATDSGPTSIVVKYGKAEIVDRVRAFHKLAGSRLRGQIPQFYGGWTDAQAERGLLLLEYIEHERQGDVLEGCSEADALALVRLLARLHGSLACPDESTLPAVFPRWTPTPMDDEKWEDRLERATSRYPDLLSTGIGLRLRDAPQRFEAEVAPLRTAPVTLIHRDVHLDNVLFRADGSPVLLDWDGVSIGPGAADLARVLAEGTSLASAHQSLAGLLAAYLEEVRKAGASDANLSDLTAYVNAAMVPHLQGAIAWAGAPGNDSLLKTRVLALRRQLLERMCDWFEG